jgi:apolipoprotein N-acyltransferase
LRLALAVLSGVLLGIAFPKWQVSLAVFIALVPLLWALKTPGPERTPVPARTGFRLGYLTGAVFHLILLYWIPRLPSENVTVPFIMYPALAVMVAYLALFPGLAAMGAAWLARRGVPLGVSFPFLWVLLEAVRGTGMFGFPWGSLGYTLAPYPHLIQFAEFTGLWGVTLWVVLVNGAVYHYLDSRWVAPKMAALAALVALVVAPFLHGQHVLRTRPVRPSVTVGVVQPNVGENKWHPAVRDSVVEAVLTHTRRLVEEEGNRQPALVVWPETAIPARLTRDPGYRSRVEGFVDSTRVPVVTGFPDGVRLPDGTVRFTNSAVLILPGLGVTQQYDKRHLVPFSESFPFPFLNRFDFGQSDFTAGKEPGVFTQLKVPFGLLICFESIFPREAREVCVRGARYIVNITNDQWFGDSAAPVQHFQMNVLRCIENRVGMVRSANTGISGVIDPYGIVRLRTGTFEPARFVASVELGNGPTVYGRRGDWILIVGAIVVLAAGGWAGARGRRSS